MATKYAKSAGGNWSSANTWSATSSAGVDNAGAPAATDDVIFDSGATGAVVVDTTSCVGKTLTTQAAANILTFTAGQILTISGNVTFYAWTGTNVSGTGTLVMHAAGTLKLNAKTFPGALTFDAAVIYVLNTSGSVTGLVSFTAACTLNWTTNESLTCAGGVSNTVASMLSGTAKIIVSGGTLQSSSASIAFVNNIDLAGNVIIGTYLAFNTKTLAYVSGTITTTSSTLYILGSCTVNTPTANMSWANITATATATLTLTSGITLTGTLTANAGVTLTLATSDVICAGIDTTSTGIITARTITMSGGTWQATGWTTGYVASSLTFAGNVTISGNVGYRTGTMTYSSGTITITNSTVNIGASCTINCPTASMHFNNLKGTGTFTLTSGVTVDGLLSSTGTITLATSDLSVAGGITVNAGGIAGVGRTITMTGGTLTGNSSYAITANLTLAGNITLGSFGFNTGTLLYSSGTITVSGGSTMYISASCTISPAGQISFQAITISQTATITLTATLPCTTFTILDGASPTISGNYYINCSTLAMFRYGASGMTFKLPDGYGINVSFAMYISGKNQGVPVVSSTTASVKSYINFSGTVANCELYKANFTDIDASGSSQSLDVWYSNAVTRCINILNRTSADLKKTGAWGSGVIALETGANARGGSGNCVKLTPSSTTDKMIWTFLVPTTAATAFQLTLWHKITSGFNGSVKCTIYDTDNTTKLVNAETVALTDDAAYHQYLATSANPTATGFCRVVIEILNGAVAGSIYVDDIVVV